MLGADLADSLCVKNTCGVCLAYRLVVWVPTHLSCCSCHRSGMLSGLSLCPLPAPWCYVLCRDRQKNRYLLHHRPCSSALKDFTIGKFFNRVIDDGKASDNTRHLSVNKATGEPYLLPPEHIRRVVLCSGQIYYQLSRCVGEGGLLRLCVVQRMFACNVQSLQSAMFVTALHQVSSQSFELLTVWLPTLCCCQSTTLPPSPHTNDRKQTQGAACAAAA